MKEALVGAGPKVQIVDSAIPKPLADQVLIRVVVSGSNPKDWKYAEMNKEAINTGDDIAGIIHAVGSDVVEFKPGDRVAAFHEMQKPYGSFAEYAISYAHTTFHIPAKTSFEGMMQPQAAYPILNIECRGINNTPRSHDSRSRSLQAPFTSSSLAAIQDVNASDYIWSSDSSRLIRYPISHAIKHPPASLCGWERRSARGVSN